MKGSVPREVAIVQDLTSERDRTAQKDYEKIVPWG
jgi:hypothetical protein